MCKTYKYYVRAQNTCSGEKRLALGRTLIRHSTAFYYFHVALYSLLKYTRIVFAAIAKQTTADLYEWLFQSMRSKWVYISRWLQIEMQL